MITVSAAERKLYVVCMTAKCSRQGTDEQSDQPGGVK